jgi:signal transduction histidine kinase
VTGRSGRRLRHAADAAFVAAVRLAGLALIVIAIYALVVLGIGSVPSARQWTLIGFSALAAALAALVYAHFDDRLTAWAGTFVRRTQATPSEVARMFSRRVAAGLSPDELLAALLESLRAGLGLAAAEVWTYSAGMLEMAAAEPARSRPSVMLGPREEKVVLRATTVGRPWLALWLPTLAAGREGGDLRAAPMVHAEELIGLLVAEREAGQPAFTRADDDALALLGRQAALALRNVRLGSALDRSMDELRRHAEALRESRARIVAAADSERRRIERDLHDGAQQHLLGLAVNLKVARELARSDPERADAILAELSTEVHAALDDLRELAHGIYPPLLAERGLVDAVRGALARSSVPGRVQADGVGRYAPETEATVYFCCVEAIQNAAKHAPAAKLDVRLWSEDGALLFEVGDDGPGFEPVVTREGAGMTNMRDRVGAQGGNLRVEAQPGAGARVIGAVPIVSAPAHPDTRALPSRAG